MSVEIDYKDLERLQKKLQRLTQGQITDFMLDSIKDLAARLLRDVIKRTPVGVYDGFVRFVTSDGKVVEFEVDKKTGGTLRRGWMIGDIKSINGGYEVEIINIVEYASYVENGHRIVVHGETKGWVEGRHMLYISEQELERDALTIIEKRLNKILREVYE